ncbi:GntR family transcriptional regulator [Pseudobutyrivibrio xylanivorans]|uniref:GntR family transcriptional regulator, arabinose operon transcriptional repressor n=1 Tax=Pseudobutyrivibrio xylanivorans DSM 14809 TaxID=1123012 RepID=A0A1M6F8M6_PSEXY|nr:GntR family transcriptional regulator [Pseudobutyrivibrio xylanivorans]SHI94040.1 GntR family transcriptional regulator, arabinose operon transcriptional repressor [Pseudobutyrivibrio xylanivorans DSM 14809]
MIPKYIVLKEKINEDILSDIYPLDSKLPTEVELAEKYNVSRSTVRQALELLVNDGIISKRWGSGNTVISKSDSSKKKTVMILMPEMKSPHSQTILEDLTSTLVKEGYTIESHETLQQYSLEREHLSTMLSDIYSGLIIAPVCSARPSTNSDLLRLLLKRQIPVIFLESAPAGLYNTTVVASDNYGRGYQMARRFINSGRKRLGGIFIHDSATSIATFSGYVDAIRDAGLTICDSCFLWCNSVDPHGINTRNVTFINKFLKHACEEAEIIYLDDDTIGTEWLFPVKTNQLELSKPIGKEVAKKLIETKKNGNASSITIPYH